MKLIALMLATALSASLSAVALAQDGAPAGRTSRGIVFVPPSTEKHAPDAKAAPPPGVGAKPVVTAVTKTPCLRAYPKADLTLDADVRSFDTALARHMRADEPRIVVDAASPFAQDARPASLNPWLATIARSGGVARSVPLTCGRGFSVGQLLQKLAELFGGRKPPAIYDAAKSYDVVLYYDSDHLVRQIVFTRRTS